MNVAIERAKKTLTSFNLPAVSASPCWYTWPCQLQNCRVRFFLFIRWRMTERVLYCCEMHRCISLNLCWHWTCVRFFRGIPVSSVSFRCVEASRVTNRKIAPKAMSKLDRPKAYAQLARCTSTGALILQAQMVWFHFSVLALWSLPKTHGLVSSWKRSAGKTNKTQLQKTTIYNCETNFQALSSLSPDHSQMSILKVLGCSTASPVITLHARRSSVHWNSIEGTEKKALKKAAIFAEKKSLVHLPFETKHMPLVKRSLELMILACCLVRCDAVKYFRCQVFCLSSEVLWPDCDDIAQENQL